MISAHEYQSLDIARDEAERIRPVSAPCPWCCSDNGMYSWPREVYDDMTPEQRRMQAPWYLYRAYGNTDTLYTVCGHCTTKAAEGYERID